MSEWFVVDSIEKLKEAIAWEGSVWVCHREPVGFHEALVGAVDAFFASSSTSSGLRCVRWPFAQASMAQAATALIGDASSPGAILAIGRGELLDKITDYDIALRCGEAFLPAFGKYITARGQEATESSASSSSSAAASSASAATVAPIDISKMVAMGKDLLAKRKPEYADKFFVKSLGVLDAFPEADRDDNMNGSAALVLSWLVISRVVLGKPGDATAFGQRLTRNYAFFVEQPLSDVARGAGLATIVAALPFVWQESECSVASLTATLSASPKDWTSRAKLAVTHYLTGDVERCLTEALKLRLNDDAAVKAMGDAICSGLTLFLGRDHDLIKRLG